MSCVELALSKLDFGADGIPRQAVFISHNKADFHDAERLRKLEAKHGHEQATSTTTGDAR